MISATDRAVANQLEDLRGDERDRFGMIQLEAAGPPLARQLAGGKNQQLVDFSRGQMHGALRRRRSYSSGYSFTARTSAAGVCSASAVTGDTRTNAVSEGSLRRINRTF